MGLWYINHVPASGHIGHMGNKHLIQYFIHFLKGYEVGKQKVWEEGTYLLWGKLGEAVRGK